MPAGQLPLFGDAPPGPEGLVYRPDLVDPQEEAAIVAALAALPFKPFQFHGFEGKRRTVSFGWQYRFDGSGLAPADPMPDFLLPLRVRAAALAGVEPEAFAHALVIEYEAGAGIGWHRDRPDFGLVVGVSLLSRAPLRFRRRRPGGGFDRFTLEAEPRSAYLLAGPARIEWEHGIAAVAALRYAVTFRTLRRAPASAQL